MSNTTIDPTMMKSTSPTPPPPSSPQGEFPSKLMKLLNGAAPEALYWLPGNQSFAINTQNFGPQVLDKFFQGAKYTTFIRKLNQW